MKKKVNIFGKSVPVFVLILLGMGLVSAALVPYLSNAVFGTVTASSPIEQKIAEGLVDASSITSVEPVTFDLSGGGEVLLSIKTENLAADPITGVAENLVTGSGGATPLCYSKNTYCPDDCDEFSKLLMRTESDIGASWPGIGPDYEMIMDEPACTSAGFVWEETDGDDGKCWDDALDKGYCSSNVTTMTILWGNPAGTTWDAKQIDITQVKAEFKVNTIGTYEFTSQIMTL